MVKLVKEVYEKVGFVYPTGQDAATFCAQEAMEMVDVFLRKKPYLRHHAQEDTLGREAAQTLMMLLITCDIGKVDLEVEFIRMLEDLLTKTEWHVDAK